MLFPPALLQRGLRSSLLALVFGASFSAAILAAVALPAAAQVTGQSAPATPSQSSASEVALAQALQKMQEPYTRDVALSVFAQYTNKTNGNFLRLDTTSSAGIMLAYRQSPRWWAGYEINYGGSRYSDIYNKGEYRVDHAVNEITAAYLMKTPQAYKGVRPFIGFGTGVIIFSPSSYGGLLVPSGSSSPATQTLPVFVFSLGGDHTFGDHLGVRVQYRDDLYKAPNFKEVSLDAHKLRNTSEPAVGVYYRF
jgi:hypothetical protein